MLNQIFISMFISIRQKMGIPLKVVLKPADANTKVQFVCSICRDMVYNHVMIKNCEHIQGVKFFPSFFQIG